MLVRVARSVTCKNCRRCKMTKLFRFDLEDYQICAIVDALEAYGHPHPSGLPTTVENLIKLFRDCRRCKMTDEPIIQRPINYEQRDRDKNTPRPDKPNQ